MRKIFASYVAVILLHAVNASAQHNLYINKIGNKTTVECVPMVQNVSFAEGNMIVKGWQTQSYPVQEVANVSLRDPGTAFTNIAPASLMARYYYEIPWAKNLQDIPTTAEPCVTDETAENYDDFVENSTFDKQVHINWDAATGTASVVGQTPGVSVTLNGGMVTVDSDEKDVEYVLSGRSSQGAFKLYSTNKARITLNGLDLSNTSFGAAINIQSKKRMFVVLADGTMNKLADADIYNTTFEEDEKGCFFSEGQLCFSGKGTLMVTGRHKRGIVSDQYIHIIDGHIQVETTAQKGTGIQVDDHFLMGGGYVQVCVNGNAAKGINSNDLITILGGEINVYTTGGVILDDTGEDYSSACAIKAAGDILLTGGHIGTLSSGVAGKGINAGGDLTIGNGTSAPIIRVKTLGKRIPEIKEDNVIVGPSSSPKGIKTMKNLTVYGGDILVSTIGGDGGEGVESKGTTTLRGGDILGFCVDDILNANNGLYIYDGTLRGVSLTNDGLDVIWLFCYGGDTYIIGGEGDQAAFDTDGKTFYYNGGTHFGVGGAMCGETDYRSKCISVNALVKGNYQYVSLRDDTGKDIIAYQIPAGYATNKKGNNYGLLFCSPLIEQNKSYMLCGSLELQNGTEKNGQIENPELKNATVLYEFTTTKQNILLK